MQITRIIEVIDTREYIEGPDDKFYPVAGSGTVNHCHRCGKPHEVHALVELEDFSAVIVGTGCMKQDSTDIQKQGKTLATKAKKTAKIKAEIKTLHLRLEAFNSAKIVATELFETSNLTIERYPEKDWEHAKAYRLGDVIKWERSKVPTLADFKADWVNDQIAKMLGKKVYPDLIISKIKSLEKKI